MEPLALDANRKFCLMGLNSVDQSYGTKNKVTVPEWKIKLKSFFDESINVHFDKIELEVLADETDRSRELMCDMATNLSRETKELGLMRLSFCLDFMMKAVTFETLQKPDYQKYIGMYPILRTEQRNAEYVVRMFLGEGYPREHFDQLIFREG